MKKIIYILLILICPYQLFGQTVTSQTKLLAQNDSLGIEIIKTGDTLKTNYFLIFNNNDSILFHSSKYSFYHTTLGFDGIRIDKAHQLDELGYRAIFLYHVYNNSPKLGGDNKTMFIINLDTKKVMFQGKYYFNNHLGKHGNGSTYSYDISFGKENLIINYNLRRSDLQPDLKEGIYSIINGEYVWKKSQYECTRRVITKNDSIGVEIVRISSCERNSNSYYIVNNNDSIIFRFTDRCIEQDPYEYKESAKLDFLQLNGIGSPELILEWEHSGDMNYTGYNKSIIIINLETMEIMFRAKIMASGRHIFGEEWGDLFSYQYDLSFTDSGNITILKQSKESSGLMEGTYTIIDGKYILQKEE